MFFGKKIIPALLIRESVVSLQGADCYLSTTDDSSDVM